MVEGNNFVPVGEPSWAGGPLADETDDVLLHDDEGKKRWCSLSVADKGNDEATATRAAATVYLEQPNSGKGTLRHAVARHPPCL